ncbi:hypothetical protein FN846DRAFT_907126 [Sphaerosporella brunnea]|uniref:Uncharacterized protein n=1 Tax=Sphaerosporella brunnea TaxID=1250544 RepID=A0A5J5EXY4_9PEZI|nr:hypothetical protein FN846DRAFT_907126 [Sphaerosporella brunnea]
MKRASEITARLDQAFWIETQAATGTRLVQEYPAPGGPARNLWKHTSAHIGDKEEAYGAEPVGIAAGLEMALTRSMVRDNLWGRVRLFNDVQAAPKRLQPTTPGPGQWVLRRISCAEAAPRTGQ